MRDGWQRDGTQVSRLLPRPPPAPSPLGKSLGLPLPLPLPRLLHLHDVPASVRDRLLQSWPPHPLSCIRGLPPAWDLSPEGPGLARVSLGGPRGFWSWNAGPACAQKRPEDILKKKTAHKKPKTDPHKDISFALHVLHLYPVKNDPHQCWLLLTLIRWSLASACLCNLGQST